MKKFTLAISLVFFVLFVFLTFETICEETIPVSGDNTVENNINDNVGTKTQIEQPNLEELQGALKKGQKMEFQAEINKLLGIIINSLYTNRDIFLRELISNASDALDKLRFLSLTNKEMLEAGEEFAIKVSSNPEQNTLIIRDTGIGMTHNDLVNNLGTIAKSGTKAFLEKISGDDNASTNLIGQFGVGFYSAFLVADTVTVASKNHEDSKQWLWSSTADGSFVVAEDPRGNSLKRGTEITLHLKDDAKEYLQPENLKKLIAKYSEYINFPIYVLTSKNVTKEVPAETTSSEEESTENKDAEVEETKSEEQKTQTVTETVMDWDIANTKKPLWTRDPEQITKDEYINFYKASTKDEQDPLGWIHFKQEGQAEFKSILYIPGKAPFNLFDINAEHKYLKLYVKRVFITDQIADLMPRFLAFVKGIVDSEDLPLNISREILQNSKILRTIKKRLVTKVINLLLKYSVAEQVAKNNTIPEEEKNQQLAGVDHGVYLNIWKEFGKSLKIGIIEDVEYRPKLLKLVRFETSKSLGKLISFDEYVERMQPNQKGIYYIAGPTLEEIKESPFLEALVKRDIEVIYFTDAIDEYVIQAVNAYGEKNIELISITKEGLDLGEDDEAKKKEEEMQKTYEPLLKKFKGYLGQKIEKAVLSNRLDESPVVIVTPKYGMSANQARIMQTQALAPQEMAKLKEMVNKMRILEINPNHRVIKKLLERALDPTIDDEKIDPIMYRAIDLLYETALFRSGFIVEDPKLYATRVFEMIDASVDIFKDSKLTPRKKTPEEKAKEEAEKAEREAEERAKDAEEMENAAKEFAAAAAKQFGGDSNVEVTVDKVEKQDL